MANFNSTYVQQINSSNQSQQKRESGNLFIARVTHVVVGPYIANTTTRDVYYNDPTDLGKITFQFLKGYQDRTLESAGNLTAKPINSAMKHIPVEGEFVQVVPGPGLALNETRGQLDYYYGPPFDLWGASHHNALPDIGDYGNYVNNTTNSPEQTSTTNRATDVSFSGSTAYPLGPNFYEKSDIKSLRVFTGDVTIEGRWGNSIRFGSTTPNRKTDNYWSGTGSIGDPITIIRNGQGAQLDKTPWVPTVENINRDPSSIYLTAGQRIVVDDIQNNFSLASWQINLDNAATTSIPLQQQLTSYDNLSPAEQDKRVETANQPNGSNDAVPRVEEVIPSEEMMTQLDEEYRTFYSDNTVYDDGFDRFWHSKIDKIPKITQATHAWKLVKHYKDNQESITTGLTYTGDYEKDLPDFRDKIKDGRITATYIPVYSILIQDYAKETEWRQLVNKLQARNWDFTNRKLN